MMSSTIRTCSPSMLEERSFRIRTRPDDSVVAPPYDDVSMRSIRSGGPLRDDLSGRPGQRLDEPDPTVLQEHRPEVAGVEELDPDVGVELSQAAELAVLLPDEALLERRHLEEHVEIRQVEVRREALDHG